MSKIKDTIIEKQDTGVDVYGNTSENLTEEDKAILDYDKRLEEAEQAEKAFYEEYQNKINE